MYDFKFLSDRFYSQIYKKILFDLKLRRKIDILYNYEKVYDSLLGKYLANAHTINHSIGKKNKGLSFTELLTFDVFYLKKYFRFRRFTNRFFNKYYKKFYLTTKYFEIYKSLIYLKNKINYKINNITLKKNLLNKKLTKKKLIYFLLNPNKDFYSFYYNISINILTKKKNKITLIRSPFIYKKSREQFIRSYVMYLFKLEKLNFKTLYKITKKLKLIFNKNISGSFLKYYFSYKYLKN
jgi:hypothetical protein